MKKLFLIFSMAAVSVFGQNIKVANPATPAQNILTGVTINNSTNLVVPGSLTVNGSQTNNGPVVVSSNLIVYGSATFSNAFFQTQFNAALATNLNAGELRSGTILTARYGAEVVLTNGNQTISGIKTFNDNIIGNGTDNTLNNQTLTGNGSIVTRVLGDARYTGISDTFSTNSSYVYATGTTQSFYNVLVRNILTVNVASILNSNVLVQAGNITVTNGQPKVILVETNASQIAGANAASRIELYGPAFANGTVFGAAYSTNSIATGSLPGDMVLRAESSTRILFTEGTTIIAYFDLIPVNNTLIFTNGTSLLIPNTITSGTNNSTVYQVGGVTGFSGVVTNDIGTVTNIMFYGSGLLTNLVRIP